MELLRLSVFNFRNHQQVDVEPDASCNAFVGDNGTGKTNMLDAIHYLAMCKSYFNPIDSQNIRHQEESCMIQGAFAIEGREEVVSCALRRQQKKLFRRNAKEYDRLSDHIGLIPLVMIAPTDTQLITEGSEERRRFLDSIIAQFNPVYLDDLVNYNRLLSQRNALLKSASLHGRVDPGMLDIFDEQLVPLAQAIHAVRLEFVAKLVPAFQASYSFITGHKEETGMVYVSALHEMGMADLLRTSRVRDLAAQFTTGGIHKDDLEFTIHGQAVKRFASQGQQKSFVVALKLAQFDLMRERLQTKPLLLLDDIFDKLDDFRVSRLMELVSDDHFGQLFISDTHPERIREIFRRIGRSIRLFRVDGNGVECLDGKEAEHA